MNLFNLEGRKAIVTGASRGLGKAMARGLAQAGAQVAVLASSQSIYDAEKELREEGLSVKAYQVNLMDRNSVEETFRQILDFFGGNLDILVNNAGIQRRNPCEDFTMEDWDDVIQMPNPASPLSAEQNEYVSTFSSSLTDYVNSSMEQMIMGTMPLSDWDTFVQNCMDKGAQKMIDAYKEVATVKE